MTTCKSCGYEKNHCICKSNSPHGTIYNRNTSGQRRIYQNYTDYRNVDDYSMTSRINRSSPETRKIMDELLPVDGESILTFLKRTELAEQKLIEHSIQHHLYGTKRVWSCHTTSRYCFICTLCQYLNVHRSIFLSFAEITDISNITLRVTQEADDDIPTLTLQLNLPQ